MPRAATPAPSPPTAERSGLATGLSLLALLVVGGLATMAVGCNGDDGEGAATTTSVAVQTTVAPETTPAPSTTVDTSPGAVLSAPIDYTVVSGDSPSSIASRYSIPLQALLDENGWELVDQQVPAFPFAGAVIRIPAGATVPVETVPGSTAVAGEEAAATTEPESGACGTYVILEGDNPTIVATKLDTTVEKLNAVNATTEGYAGFILGLTIQVPC